MEIKEKAEGLIFLSGEQGMGFQELLQALNADPFLLNEALEELMKEYENRGFILRRFGDRFKFVGSEQVYSLAREHYEQTRQKNLSRAAMETLSIIAYAHPISRLEIEEIRGVNCDSVLRSLLALDLVEIKKQPDQRALAFVPGPYFLDYFGLESMDELPKLENNKSQSLFDQKDSIEKQVSALFSEPDPKA